MFQWLKHMIGRRLQSSGTETGAADVKSERPTLNRILEEFEKCSDLCHRSYPEIEVDLVYFQHLVGADEFDRAVVQPLNNVRKDEVKALLERSEYIESTDNKAVVKAILEGWCAVFHGRITYVVNVYNPETRAVEQSETETIIVGPHDAFVESLSVNLSLIRRRLKSSHLKIERLTVGEVAKTEVCICYIDGIANEDYVEDMIERIKNIEVDAIHDGNMLIQHIDDSPNSLFPLFMTSERVDAAVSKLVAGRIVGVMDHSPSVISAPSAFFDFFSSPDDYYQRWPLATAIRLLRLVSFVITILMTSLYVSVTTYHYEMIPEALLSTLTESRSRVPFPPVYEALLMETTVELLREAGARLPTKIGQTIGIVGGIVIGQASVQAGFTSNVLIISVALSAISSFVIPSYVMSASIRLVRFGLILLAGLWGNLGLMLGLALFVIHLSGLKSLKAAYLRPIAPFRFSDWKDVFVRGPFYLFKNRPSIARSPNPTRNRMRK